MNETHGYCTKQLYPQRENVFQLRLNRTTEVEDFYCRNQ